MSRTRSAAKYTAAGAVTVLYGSAIYVALSGKVDPKPVAPTKVALVAAGMAALTWIAALS